MKTVLLALLLAAAPTAAPETSNDWAVQFGDDEDASAVHVICTRMGPKQLACIDAAANDAWRDAQREAKEEIERRREGLRTLWGCTRWLDRFGNPSNVIGCEHPVIDL